MLFTIVLLFVLCWLPIHTFSLLVWFYPNILNLKLKVEYFTYVGAFFACHWISQFHSLVNPIVYCFMSESFRVIDFLRIKPVDFNQTNFLGNSISTTCTKLCSIFAPDSICAMKRELYQGKRRLKGTRLEDPPKPQKIMYHHCKHLVHILFKPILLNCV